VSISVCFVCGGPSSVTVHVGAEHRRFTCDKHVSAAMEDMREHWVALVQALADEAAGRGVGAGVDGLDDERPADQ
jgi:hypothetical protein